MAAEAQPQIEPQGRGPRSRIGALSLKVHHANASLAPEVPDAAILKAAVRHALRDLGRREDDSYWVIQRLKLQFSANPRFQVQGVAEAFARAMKDALSRVLAGQIVQGVRRFESRAHWLAACLWAIRSDDLKNAWPFARYRHLAALPQGDQARLALDAEVADAWVALELLDEEGKLDAFLQVLSERAINGIVANLLQNPDLPVVDQVQPELALAIETARQQGVKGAFASILTALVRLRSSGAADALPTLRALERGRRATAWTPDRRAKPVSVRDQKGQRRLKDNMAVTDQDPRQIPDPMPQRAGNEDNYSPEWETVTTRYAGVFALWRSVEELELPTLLSGGDQEGPQRLALAAALTGPDFADAWRDPALHWLTGYVPDDDETPSPPVNLIQDFIRHYQSWRAPEPVSPTVRQVGASHLLQDCATEDWLAFGSRRYVDRHARRIGPVEAPPPGSRDPVHDANWFRVSHRAKRRPWVILARAAYGDFARRLHGLERSSARWCWEKLLAGEGQLRIGEEATVILPKVDLDVVLRMGAIDSTCLRGARGDVRIQLPEVG